MSSGEADAFRVTLDTFRRCPVPGCEWMVQTIGAAERRCYHHGGPRAPQYVPGSEGEMLRPMHMPAASTREMQ